MNKSKSKKQSDRNPPIAKKLIEDLINKEEKHLRDINSKYSPRYTTTYTKFLRSRFIHKNLFSIVSHPEILEKSYYINRTTKGANTKGSDDNKQLDGISIERILEISKSLKLETYEFAPIRRVWIPKPGKQTKRPLGIPTPQDKIVHTSVNIVLQALYEPEFSLRNWNYGFRPNRSCHNALEQIKAHGKGMNQVIEGDIKGAYDTVNHDKLIQIIARRTTDKKFLRLIKKILKTGILDNRLFQQNDLGVPQGSNLSPTLWNIYMHEFDIFVNEEIQSLAPKYRRYFKERETPDKHKKDRKAYRQAEYQKRKTDKSLNNSTTQEERENLRKLRKELNKVQQALPSTDNPPEHNVRVAYIRYADDWIIMLNGPKWLAKLIKNKCQSYLRSELYLTLSEDKTRITDPSEQPFLFLGHNIYQIPTRRLKKVTKGEKTMVKRTTYRDINFRVPFQERIIPRLNTKYLCDGKGFPREIPPITVCDDASIAIWYRQVMYGYMNFFAEYCPKSDIQRLHYIILYSAYKTLAHKHRTSVQKIRKKYETEDWAIKVKPQSTKGRDIVVFHYRDYKKPKFSPIPPSTTFKNIRRKTRHHFYQPCWYCGSQERIEMHHIKAHGRGNQKTTWSETAKIIQARQVPLCRQCHIKTHQGLININDIIKHDE
jgi:group II intron reverse transcriptase/maturase